MMFTAKSECREGRNPYFVLWAWVTGWSCCQQQWRKAAARGLRTGNRTLDVTSVKPELPGSHVLPRQGRSAAPHRAHDARRAVDSWFASEKLINEIVQEVVQGWHINQCAEHHTANSPLSSRTFPLFSPSRVPALWAACILPRYPQFPLPLASILWYRVKQCLWFIFQACTCLQGLHYWPVVLASH